MIKNAVKSTLNSLGLEVRRKIEPPRQMKAQQDPGPSNPEMVADKTYNPDHPNYDANKVKNYPGTFYQISGETDRTESSRSNPLLQRLLLERSMHLTGHSFADYDFLRTQIEGTAAELRSDPNYANFEAKLAKLDSFIDELNARGPGKFFHGGVSLDKAKFLYWLVRTFKPKKIVQTGTSNGVSCAFITMALAKNDNNGKLLAVDWPQIYDANDSFWQQADIFGVVIPPGKTSGWLVPDNLAQHFEVRQGDAKAVLPKYLDEIGEIDLFYHDSDHSYAHMLFEFEEAYPHVRKHGLILADDIAWSTVTWDFAESKGCYALNHAGSQGLVFV